MHYEINNYPDGSKYVKASSYPSTFTFKINRYEDLWILNQILDVYKYQNENKPTVTIPNLLDAQADRRFAKNESFGLKLVCDFLNKMYANFKIFHPHNPEVVEALMDNVKIMDNTYFIKEVLSKIYCEQVNIKRDEGIFYHVNHNISNIILMSSDAGGFKPLIKLCKNIDWKGETHSCSKARINNGNKYSLVQKIGRYDFKGKDILIVDDICVYGGTFKGLANKLRERNCGKLYLAVSHMTIQNLGNDPVTNYFDSVFCTNSKFDSYYTPNTFQPKILEVIKLF